MPKAFLITPFSPERAGNEDPRIFRQVQQAIAEAARACGVELVHPAVMNEPGVIMDQVQRALEEADVILAILTGQNPNVFYELGMAMGNARRQPILIVSSIKEVPFDVRHFRFWTYSREGELEQLAEQLAAAIHSSLASPPRLASGPQPLLEARTIENGEWAALSYRARAVPLVGRDAEMAQLESFLQAPRKFLWQSLHGPGGSGKSRLALELCLSVKATWSAGFLPTHNGFQDKWMAWLPTRPTLVVIDEVEVRAQEVGAVLQTMSLRQDELAYPVRLLLLGRERLRQLEKILGIDPYEWEALYKTSAFGAPYSLGPLSESQAAEVARQASKQPFPKETLFNQDPQLRLPLFAALAGLASAQSGQALRWDYTTVTRFVLEREHLQHWQGCTAEDENLLAYLNITGPQPLDFLLEPLAGGLFPTDPETALDHNQIMASHDGPELMPLQPGPLGELFVLDLLAKAKLPAATLDRGHQVVDVAMQVPIVSAEFVLRAMAHFPDHPGIPRLVAAEIPRFDAGSPDPLPFGFPILLDSIADFVYSGEIAQAKAFTAAAELLERRGYSEITVWGGSGEAAFNLITALAEMGEWEEVSQAIDALETFISDREKAIDPLGRAFSNAIHDAVDQDRADVAWPLIRRFQDLVQKRPTLVKYLSGALVSAVRSAPDAGQAEELFRSSFKFLETSPDDPQLGADIARLAFNVANRAQRDGQGEAALRTFEAILDLSERLPSGVVPPELVARAAIPTGTAVTSVGAQDAARFIQRVKAFAYAHRNDINIRGVSLTGLYNVVTVLGLEEGAEAERNALQAFEVLCQGGTWGPRLEGAANDCLAAAYRLAFQDPKGERARRVREILSRYLPEALEPEFLSSREAAWGTDLSFFR